MTGSNEKRKKKLVLKIVANTWENASRDIRELSVVRELGANVLVMAKGEKTGVQEVIKGFPVYRMSTRPLGKYVPNVINRFISTFTWAYQARKFKPDVISGHDLIPLFIGCLSSCFLKKKNHPKLVYDSHEFTIYAGKKNKFQIFLTKHLEHFLIKKCAFTIEVNDLISDEVQKIHKLKERPIVVRNIPPKWNIDPKICKEVRKQIMLEFGESNSFFLLMYHGGLMPERGIETLIEVLSLNSKLCLYLLGNGAETYVESLMKLAKQKGVNHRIVIHKAIPHEELWKYIGAADVGMITVKAAWKSYYYMLPNKFFENIQAETPVICSDFPAIKELVKKYQIGITCNPEMPEKLNQCIEKLRLDQKFYQKCKRNMQIAKKELCWEEECLKLKKAYKKIF